VALTSSVPHQSGPLCLTLATRVLMWLNIYFKKTHTHTLMQEKHRAQNKKRPSYSTGVDLRRCCVHSRCSSRHGLPPHPASRRLLHPQTHLRPSDERLERLPRGKRRDYTCVLHLIRGLMKWSFSIQWQGVLCALMSRAVLRILCQVLRGRFNLRKIISPLASSHMSLAI